MGLFSFIGSAISGVARAVGSAISSVGRALSSFASSTLGIVGNLAAKAASFVSLVTKLPLGPLGPILGPIVAQLIIHAVVKGIEYLAKKLGIIKEEDKAEEVGYRVEEAQQHEDWKKQEDFKTFDEYYAYLKQQIPDEKIDIKKLAENRNQYMILGTMELTKGIEDQMKIQLPEDFLFEIGRSRMEPDEIRAIVEAFKEVGYSSVLASDYFKGKLTREENRKIEAALLNNMRKYYPQKDDDALYERLGVMRMASRNDSKLEDIYSDKLTEENLKRIEEAGKVPENL